MLLPLLAIVSLASFPFYMWFSLKRLTEIRDLLKEKDGETIKEKTD